VEIKIQNRRTQIQQLKAQLINSHRQAQRLPGLQREYDTLKTEIESMNEQLPRDKDFSGLLRLLTRQLSRFQLNLTTLAPGPIRTDAHYQTLPIQITLTGRFHDLGRFLTAVGTRKRMLSADNLMISLAATNNTDATIQANLTILAYMSNG
jgi:type IV pilus assembly protein PilO